MSLSPSRVVGILTPILAAGAAVGTPWLAKVTGLHLTPSDVTALAVTGATAVVAPALKWLDGNSKFEREYGELKQYWEDVKPDLIKAEDEANAADPGIVQDIEGQADKVVDAAKAKLIAVLTPTPEGHVVAAVPVVDAPAPVADPPAAA